MITLNPYINFNTNAEEALNFYKDIFGGELTIMRFSDMPANPDYPVAAEHQNLVMHGDLQADNLRLMAADSAPTGGAPTQSNISVSLSGDDEETLTRYYNVLLEGGKATVPLAKAPWGDTFGMLTDKFGVAWFVNIGAAQAS